MNDEIIERAVELAIKDAAGREWKLGDTVCHPNEPITCQVLTEKSVNGLITIGCVPNGIEWIVPACECFDPNQARDIALGIKFGIHKGFDGLWVAV